MAAHSTMANEAWQRRGGRQSVEAVEMRQGHQSGEGTQGDSGGSLAAAWQRQQRRKLGGSSGGGSITATAARRQQQRGMAGGDPVNHGCAIHSTKKGSLVDTDKKETQIARTSHSLTHHLFHFSLLFYSQSISVHMFFGDIRPLPRTMQER